MRTAQVRVVLLASLLLAAAFTVIFAAHVACAQTTRDQSSANDSSALANGYSALTRIQFIPISVQKQKGSQNIDAEKADLSWEDPDMAGQAPNSDVAPDFTLEDMATGRHVSLHDFRGKTVLLTFFALGCGPCMAHIPNLVAIQKDYEKDGLIVLAPETLDYGHIADEKSWTRTMAHDKGINYRILWDPGGIQNGVLQVGGVMKKYNTDVWGQSYLIGPDGKFESKYFLAFVEYYSKLRHSSSPKSSKILQEFSDLLKHH